MYVYKTFPSYITENMYVCMYVCIYGVRLHPLLGAQLRVGLVVAVHRPDLQVGKGIQIPMARGRSTSLSR